MGFCLYFHRNWRPGYNTEVIDPNLAYNYQKKLDLAKKIAWFTFILTLIVALIVLLVVVSKKSGKDCKVVEVEVEEEGTKTYMKRTSNPPDFSPQSCNCRCHLEIAAPEKLCDPSGESRCPDRSDQLGCPCRPDSFVCDSNTSECIHQNLVCDSVKDCANGYDEDNCTALSSSVTNLKIAEYSNSNTLEGYALARVRGSWHLYCSDGWTQKLGMNICGFLGFSTLDSLNTTHIRDVSHRDKKAGDSGEYVPSEEHEEKSPQLLVIHPQVQKLDTGTINDIAVKADPQQHADYVCEIAYLKCSK